MNILALYIKKKIEIVYLFIVSIHSKIEKDEEEKEKVGTL